MHMVGIGLARLEPDAELAARPREALQARPPHLPVREHVPPVLRGEDHVEVRLSPAGAYDDQLQFANDSSSSADQEAPEGPARFQEDQEIRSLQSAALIPPMNG